MDNTEEDEIDHADYTAQRRPRTEISVTEALTHTPGRRGRQKGYTVRPESRQFITLKGPTTSTRLALSYYPALLALWRLWALKKASSVDCGVKVSEIARELGVTILSIKTSMESLLKNALVRQLNVAAGTIGTRKFYFPTELGVKLIGLTEDFGYGYSIQIGEIKKQNLSKEPEGFFKRAIFLRGALT